MKKPHSAMIKTVILYLIHLQAPSASFKRPDELAERLVRAEISAILH
jgi:hypothetical protein